MTKIDIGQVLTEANKLPVVPVEASTAYQKAIPGLIKEVDANLASHEQIHDLVGGNPLQVMYDNHKHHTAFMTTVFFTGSYELLTRIMVWVYNSYHAHGFSYDYFPAELQAWKDAVESQLGPEHSAEIMAIYSWMLAKHEHMISLATEPIGLDPVKDDWLETKNAFLEAVLLGDRDTCLQLFSSLVDSQQSLEEFYMQVMQPVLYEVGILWQDNKISVATEHLASAIISRVMASHSQVNIPYNPVGDKRILITATSNEFHEMGASMIADIMEHDGWIVQYLGSNMPVEELLSGLIEFKPQVLAISVTMPFNVMYAREIISAVVDNKELENIQVMIGGQAFHGQTDLWQKTGAHGFAVNAQQARDLANSWVVHATD